MLLIISSGMSCIVFLLLLLISSDFSAFSYLQKTDQFQRPVEFPSWPSSALQHLSDTVHRLHGTCDAVPCIAITVFSWHRYSISHQLPAWFSASCHLAFQMCQWSNAHAPSDSVPPSHGLRWTTVILCDFRSFQKVLVKPIPEVLDQQSFFWKFGQSSPSFSSKRSPQFGQNENDGLYWQSLK